PHVHLPRAALPGTGRGSGVRTGPAGAGPVALHFDGVAWLGRAGHDGPAAGGLMFTGIVSAIGVVQAVEPLRGARRIRIGTPAGYTDGMKEGDSVAIDGVCQTVVSHAADGFTVEAI